MKKMRSNSFKNVPQLLFVLLLYIGYWFTLESSIENQITTHTVELFQNNSVAVYAVSEMTPIIEANNRHEASLLLSSGRIDVKNVIAGNVNYVVTDPRSLAMREYLIDYNSPMYLYSAVFVEEADKYGLDWRLVASISGVESAFGKFIPYNSNNAWGWRGGPGGAYSQFNSWGDGIATVTRGLAVGYGTHLTPFQIEPVYCPPCGRNPRHTWAHGVTNNMAELDYYLRDLEN